MFLSNVYETHRDLLSSDSRLRDVPLRYVVSHIVSDTRRLLSEANPLSLYSVRKNLTLEVRLKETERISTYEDWICSTLRGRSILLDFSL